MHNHVKQRSVNRESKKFLLSLKQNVVFLFRKTASPMTYRAFPKVCLNIMMLTEKKLIRIICKYVMI